MFDVKKKLTNRINLNGSDMVEKMFAAAKDPELISFGAGVPAPELLPVENIATATQAAFADFGATMLNYDGSYGVEPLRAYIAETRLAGIGIEAVADDVCILSGSQQGLDIMARLYINEGDTIIVEEPTYPGASNSFSPFHPHYVSVPMDEQGMKMDCLEATIKANPDTKFIYTVPDFQNPSGITMSIERRKQLVALAEQYGILVIEDSPYCELSYTGIKMPAIKSFDTRGVVIHFGSLSKILAPGFRIGWVCAQPDIIKLFRLAKEAADFQACTTTEYMLLSYVQRYDLDAQIKANNSVYQKRRDAAVEALRAEMPECVSFTEPDGGFFCWLTIPGVNTLELLDRACKEIKVAFVPGATSFVQGDRADCLRLSFAQKEPDDIREGIKRLAALIRSTL